jgi:hypothetical protein
MCGAGSAPARSLWSTGDHRHKSGQSGILSGGVFRLQTEIYFRLIFFRFFDLADRSRRIRIRRIHIRRIHIRFIIQTRIDVSVRVDRRLLATDCHQSENKNCSDS